MSKDALKDVFLKGLDLKGKELKVFVSLLLCE